jgi:dynein light chain Tctex-type 1
MTRLASMIQKRSSNRPSDLFSRIRHTNRKLIYFACHLLTCVTRLRSNAKKLSPISFSLSAKINDWSNSIITAALKGLQSLNRPYKYAITVIIMQKTGAGLVSAASTYWDIKKDGLCKVSWENATMLCVATAYGTSVNIDYPEV